MTADSARLPLASLTRRDAAPGNRVVSPGVDRAAWLRRVQAWRAVFAPRAGQGIALALEDGIEFSAALFGAWCAGATPWLPADTLPATLQRLVAEGLVFAGELPGGLVAGEGGSDDDGEPLDAHRCTLVLFTSGSTGDPVAITKTLRQLDAEVAALETAFGDHAAGATVQGTVSHQHIYGLLFRLLWPLSAGRPFAPRRLAYNEQLTTLGPEPLVLVASPAHLKRLPATQDWSRLARGLRAVFSSGGPLPADAAQDVQRLWSQAAIEVFGSTETGGIAWRAADGRRNAWQPLPGVQWRLQDDHLQVRSPHLADDGWFASSDRAFAAGDGRFELMGRADRIVKLEERRISLDAIEARLRDNAWLEEVRVVALPGHRVLLAVAAVPTAAGRTQLAADGRAAFSQKLRDMLSGHCDPIALPRRWRFLDTLPVDSRGKTSARALAALFRPLMPEPTWLSRDAHAAAATLVATPDLAAFEGHFPQAAILPGVVMVDWAVRLGREAFGPAGDLLRMDAVKFQHLVRPGVELRADLTWTPGTLGFRFTSANGVHSSGRLRFVDGGAA